MMMIDDDDYYSDYYISFALEFLFLPLSIGYRLNSVFIDFVPDRPFPNLDEEGRIKKDSSCSSLLTLSPCCF